MYTFVMIKNTRRRSLCKPLEIEFNNNFFLCKLLRAVTLLIIFGKSVRRICPIILPKNGHPKSSK